jgi:hypothetical protein
MAADRESLGVRDKVSDVQSYVVELTAHDAAELAIAGERARDAAEQLTREGTPLRWVRSVYVPEEHTCQLVFEATTPEAVDAASQRAGLNYKRIRALNTGPQISEPKEHR